ncbi:hypothetical protein OI70_11525 [Dickeya fangzhongdai]|nr:hypothetical protein OI70_11525 [Dickeya fangzhongdai]
MIFNKLPADIVNKQNPFVSMARETQDFPDITVNIVAVFSRLIFFFISLSIFTYHSINKNKKQFKNEKYKFTKTDNQASSKFIASALFYRL